MKEKKKKKNSGKTRWKPVREEESNGIKHIAEKKCGSHTVTQ